MMLKASNYFWMPNSARMTPHQRAAEALMVYKAPSHDAFRAILQHFRQLAMMFILGIKICWRLYFIRDREM